MFKDRYEILEAANGMEGLKLLRENISEVSAILLDMIMPQMDGKEFLNEKNRMSDAAIQLGMLKNGVSDYIVKPFEFELAQHRVENAMAYQSRFRQLVEEYRAIWGSKR